MPKSWTAAIIIELVTFAIASVSLIMNRRHDPVAAERSLAFFLGGTGIAALVFSTYWLPK